MGEIYINEIYSKQLGKYDGYESFCYQNCLRILLENRYGLDALLLLNTVPTIEFENNNKLFWGEKDGFRSLLPSVDQYIERTYYNENIDGNQVCNDNLKYIYKNEKPIIVGVDPYYLPYTSNYRCKHASHTIILCGYDLKKGNVYIIDWYKTWYYKGKLDIKTFIKARNSKNEKDSSFYSGTPICNNWATIKKIPNISEDKLFGETVKLAKSYYYNFSEEGIISALFSLQGCIKLLEDESKYNDLYFGMYTLHNRKKIFMEYVDYYLKFKYKNNNVDFIRNLKKNIEHCEVVGILLLKQTKRYSKNTNDRIIRNINELIEEEKDMIEKFENLFSKGEADCE